MAVPTENLGSASSGQREETFGAFVEVGHIQAAVGEVRVVPVRPYLLAPPPPSTGISMSPHTPSSAKKGTQATSSSVRTKPSGHALPS